MFICFTYFPSTLSFFVMFNKMFIELTFLATPTDLGTFPYFAESTLDVLGGMAFSIPIGKDELNEKNP